MQPRILGDRLGRKTYNFAISAGLAPSSFFLLQRALDAGARPSAVVVNFAPTTLQASPGRESDNWSELLSLDETVDLARSTRGVELFSGVVARQVLPTLRVRFNLLARLIALSRGRANPTAVHLARFLRNRGANDGALMNPPSPIDRRSLERFRRFFTFWTFDRTNAEYLERFLALAEARGIPVFWLLTPTAPELLSSSERAGFEAAYTSFVASAQGRHLNVTVIDARRSDYGDEIYVADPLYLNRRGALVLSDDLAPIIARHLSEGDASRWVAMPRARAPPPGIEEDSSPSYVARTLPSSTRH